MVHPKKIALLKKAKAILEKKKKAKKVAVVKAPVVRKYHDDLKDSFVLPPIKHVQMPTEMYPVKAGDLAPPVHRVYRHCIRNVHWQALYGGHFVIMSRAGWRWVGAPPAGTDAQVIEDNWKHSGSWIPEGWHVAFEYVGNNLYHTLPTYGQSVYRGRTHMLRLILQFVFDNNNTLRSLAEAMNVTGYSLFPWAGNPDLSSAAGEVAMTRGEDAYHYTLRVMSLLYDKCSVDKAPSTLRNGPAWPGVVITPGLYVPYRNFSTYVQRIQPPNLFYAPQLPQPLKREGLGNNEFINPTAPRATQWPYGNSELGHTQRVAGL